MSCESYESLIALHVEGDLTPAETEELERHLRDCAACRRFADEMRASQRALKEHGRAAVDPAVLAGIRAGVLRRIERRQRAWPRIVLPRPRRLPTRVLALAASLVLMVGAVVLLLYWDEIGRPEAPAWQHAEIEPAPPAPTPEPTPTPAPPPAPPAPEAERMASGPRQAGPRQAGPRQAGPRRVEEPVTPRIAQQELPASPRSAEQPMVIKLVSDDLVIYWLVEPEATQEEKDHEISTT